MICIENEAESSFHPTAQMSADQRDAQLVVAATWEKVKQNPEVKRVLLSTGDLILKPDHHQEPNAPAAWRYFEILMKIRTELQRRER